MGRFLVFIFLFTASINLNASSGTHFSYKACSSNPFLALMAAQNKSLSSRCLEGALNQANITMAWERLILLRKQYQALAQQSQFANPIQANERNQQLAILTHEIAKFSWLVSKIPNPHFAMYFHPFSLEIKQEMIALWKTRLNNKLLTPKIWAYAKEIERTIKQQYNIQIKRVSPHFKDHVHYTYANCQNDPLLAFEAARKAQDHPRCLEGALQGIARYKNGLGRFTYFSLLPTHLQNQLADFLTQRYYFRYLPPNLGAVALSQNQPNFGQSGFWALGHQAIAIQSELDSVPIYRLWYQDKFLRYIHNLTPVKCAAQLGYFVEGIVKDERDAPCLSAGITSLNENRILLERIGIPIFIIQHMLELAHLRLNNVTTNLLLLEKLRREIYTYFAPINLGLDIYKFYGRWNNPSSQAWLINNFAEPDVGDYKGAFVGEMALIP